MALLIFLCSVIIGYLIYKWMTTYNDVFAKRGIPFEKPLPFIGNSLPLFRRKTNLYKTLLNIYKKNKHKKVSGYFNMRYPMFIVHDPDMIREIGVKEIASFTNHQQFVDVDHDPIFSSLLTSMRDQRWRNMRNTLTPLFTGAKMRAMFTLMLDCFDESMNYVRDQGKGSGSFELEMRECFSKLSNDLIATTAFGLQVNSFKDEKNEFFQLGKEVINTQRSQIARFLINSAFPKIAKIFKIRLLPSNFTDFFIRVVVDAMEYRKKNNIVRPDMIHLLMEAQKESKEHWTNEEVVAQCLIFFFAAFQNNANLLSITCQLLMETPDAQERLYEEIAAVSKQLNGKKLDYDTLQSMEYLDMVVNESLRKWPLTPILDRACNKDCTFRDEAGNVVCEMRKGDRIWMQVIGLHWDEEYFDDPQTFRPERFSKENKNNINPYTYVPFGVGLRNCIGSRYALMQGKAMLYYLVKDFRIERCEKSIKDFLEEMQAFDIRPKSGFWFKLRSRQQEPVVANK